MRINTSKKITQFVWPLVFSFLLIPTAMVGGTNHEGPEDFEGFVNVLLGILAPLIPLLIGLTLLVFFWGLARFILKMDDEQERKTGKKLMLWGIVALFVMISIWGILEILIGDLLGSGFFGLPLLPTD